ncbi:unnamed protein product, partial [Bubo scandiacus]
MLRALLLLGGLAPALPAGPHWAYEGPHGQQHWPEGHPACGGRAQSPIDIATRRVRAEPSLPPVGPVGYRRPGTPTFTLANNGHTAVLVLPPSLRLQGLPRPFAAAQLHFHWGRPGRARGAEHLLDGHRAPAEMHVVHYDAERYANASQAQHHAGGLAVLGVLLEVGADAHPAYDNILSHLGSIRYAASRTCCPRAWTSTTATTGPSPPPPCFQGVLWTLFQQPVRISLAQLEQLQGALYATTAAEPEPQPLVDNFRGPQELNQRLVLSSFPRGPKGYSTGEIVAIVFGTGSGCLSLFLVAHFVAKRMRARRAQEQDVVFKASSRHPPLRRWPLPLKPPLRWTPTAPPPPTRGAAWGSAPLEIKPLPHPTALVAGEGIGPRGGGWILSAPRNQDPRVLPPKLGAKWGGWTRHPHPSPPHPSPSQKAPRCRGTRRSI